MTFAQLRIGDFFVIDKQDIDSVMLCRKTEEEKALVIGDLHQTFMPRPYDLVKNVSFDKHVLKKILKKM